MFDPGFLKWKYFFAALPIHLFVVFFLMSPVPEVVRQFPQWLAIATGSYLVMAIPFAIAIKLPWITISGKREFIFLIVLGVIRGFAVLDIGLILNVPQAEPLLIRPLNSAVTVPLWFFGIRYILGSQQEFKDLFHELYLRYIRASVDKVVSPKKTLKESEIESIEEQVRSTLKPLREQIEKLTGTPMDREALRRESLAIQSFIEEKLRPLSHSLWRQQRIAPPRFNHLKFLAQLLFTTKPQFGHAIFPSAVFGLVGVTTITDFETALSYTSISVLIQVFIFLIYDFSYRNFSHHKNYFGLIAVMLCSLLPVLNGYFFLNGNLFSTIPWTAHFVGLIWFLMLTIAFSVAKAQTDLQQQIKGIILTAIEKQSSKSTASNLAADYATYLHGDVQSHMSSVSMKLNQAAESGEIEVGKGVIDNLASVLARDHQNYVVSQALSPLQKFQKIIDAWDGIATISIDVIDDQISQSLLLEVSEILEELVSNAIRHAGAQVMEVQIQAEGMYLLLTTKDDGKNYTKGKKGVGTELIKNKTVSQSYSREEDQNVFTFKLPL